MASLSSFGVLGTRWTQYSNTGRMNALNMVTLRSVLNPPLNISLSLSLSLARSRSVKNMGRSPAAECNSSRGFGSSFWLPSFVQRKTIQAKVAKWIIFPDIVPEVFTWLSQGSRCSVETRCKKPTLVMWIVIQYYHKSSSPLGLKQYPSSRLAVI